jgi:hypothetical protein
VFGIGEATILQRNSRCLLIQDAAQKKGYIDAEIDVADRRAPAVLNRFGIGG